MGKVPELEHHCGSWIIARDDKAVCETFSRNTAESFAGQKGYTVYTALQWLGKLNEEIKRN